MTNIADTLSLSPSMLEGKRETERERERETERERMSAMLVKTTKRTITHRTHIHHSLSLSVFSSLPPSLALSHTENGVCYLLQTKRAMAHRTHTLSLSFYLSLSHAHTHTHRKRCLLSATGDKRAMVHQPQTHTLSLSLSLSSSLSLSLSLSHTQIQKTVLAILETTKNSQHRFLYLCVRERER